MGVNSAKSADQTIYDPTCGSGSLLLKAHDEARSNTGLDLALYGQENDNATAALAKMNMINSHNYASAADFVCRCSSPNLQLLALERYYGYKEGLNDEKIIARLAFKDAIFHLDSNNLKVMEHYIKQRTTHYENEFSKISNLTILDPDSDSKFKHRLDSECYQKVIQQVIKKYQKAIP